MQVFVVNWGWGAPSQKRALCQKLICIQYQRKGDKIKFKLPTTNTTYYIIQHVANLSTCFPLELSRSGVPCKIQYHIWWPMIHILPYTRAKESSRSPGIHGRWSLDLTQACRPAAPSIGAQGVFLTFPRTVRCTRIFENSPVAEISFCFRPCVGLLYSSHRGGEPQSEHPTPT